MSKVALGVSFTCTSLVAIEVEYKSTCGGHRVGPSTQTESNVGAKHATSTRQTAINTKTKQFFDGSKALRPSNVLSVSHDANGPVNCVRWHVYTGRANYTRSFIRRSQDRRRQTRGRGCGFYGFAAEFSRFAKRRSMKNPEPLVGEC
ncbi:hypothetical protein EDB87DRAFT_1825529 [Lactarius vividus]|nr:hypothetical protein EDB87DRAFT_1825529 [Lactarius vividus]